MSVLFSAEYPQLTAIEDLSTTAFGRALLEAIDAAALRALANAQQQDATLDAIAGATPIADGPHTVGANTITTVGGIITAIS